MDEQRTDPGGDPQDIVIQLLRVLSEVDLEGLGEDLRRLDSATTRRAMTGASLLAEAVTRAMLGSGALGEALDTEFSDAPAHVSHRARGVRIEVHDDEADPALDSASEA